jgi:hypothetical protein
VLTPLSVRPKKGKVRQNQNVPPAPAPAPARKPAAKPAQAQAQAPRRAKKGPKRVKKAAATVADLDQDMEDYRAAVSVPPGDGLKLDGGAA